MGSKEQASSEDEFDDVAEDTMSTQILNSKQIEEPISTDGVKLVKQSSVRSFEKKHILILYAILFV
jgi:hypothetical protein